MRTRRSAAGIIAFVFSSSFLFAGIASANSYSFSPLFEEDLPERIAEVAAWRYHFTTVRNGRSEVLHKGYLVPEEKAIRRFFEEGTHFLEEPVEGPRAELKRLEERADAAAERFAALPESEFFKPETRELRERELDGFADAHREITDRIREVWGCEGAVIDDEGRIFLWRLETPTVLRVVYRSGSACYLHLPDEPVALRERPLVEAPARPRLADGKFPFSPGFLPGTNMPLFLDRSSLRRFFEHSVATSETELDPALSSRHVTDFSIPLNKYQARRHDRRDVLGHRILGGGLHSQRHRFTGIFSDAKGSLWHARLYSDAHLRLDDGAGGVLYLVKPGLLEEGHGKVAD